MIIWIAQVIWGDYSIANSFAGLPDEVRKCETWVSALLNGRSHVRFDERQLTKHVSRAANDFHDSDPPTLVDVILGQAMKQLVNLFRNTRKKSKLSRRDRTRIQRHLHSQSLERRELLAGDLLADHNYSIPADVNGDYKVSALDALLVINQMSRSKNAQSLAGETASSPANYYDVNADRLITPLDALRVLNEMQKPEGAGELVEFQIQPRTAADGDFASADFNQATRTLTVGVGEVFNLELGYQDLRTFNSDPGVFTISSNFVTNQADALEPVLIETQKTLFAGKIKAVTSGDVLIAMAGETTVTVPYLNFFGTASGGPTAISNALVSFGYTTSQFVVSNTSISPDPSSDPNVPVEREYTIHFTDLALADINIPNITITTANLKDSSNAPVTITSTISEVKPRNTDGSINQAAIPLNIDFHSRSISGNPLVYGTGGLVTGTFNPATGFVNVSAIGPLSTGGGIANFVNPFDALSIPVRVIKPTSTLRVTLAPTGDSSTPVTLYGNDNPVPDSMVLYNTTNSPTDATDGVALLNIVAVAQPITVTANDSALNFTEDGVAKSLNLAPLTTVVGSNVAPTFTITTQPARGTVAINGTTVTYTPVGDDFTPPAISFVYTATVGTSKDTGTINVSIAGVNDPPEFTADTAVAASRGVPKTITGSTLLVNDKPGPANESGTVTISAVSPASAQGGTVILIGQNIVYTSSATFTGTDTITYTISDGSTTNGTAAATLSVNVTLPNTVIVTAGNSTQSFSEDGAAQSLNLSTLTTVVGSNVAPTFAITTQPARGTLTLTGSTATYTPADDDFTTTSLSYVYTATVGASSDAGTVTINIASVNDAPVFVADTAVSAIRGVAKTIVGSTLLANDKPGPANETGTVSISAVTAATTNGGTVALNGQSLVYTSASGFTGADTIRYTISDGTLTTQATLSVNVTAPTGVTVTANNGSLAFAEGGAAKTLNLTTLTTVIGSTTAPTFAITTQPARGTLTISGSTVTYTPAADDFTTTPLTFVYSATVGSVTDSGTVSITITPVNDPPVFVADTALSTNRGVAVTVATSTLLGNDKPGPANETGPVAIAATPAPSATNGTVAVSGGNLVYTPTGNFVGTDTIRYSINDGSLTAAATLTVVVSAPNVVTVTAGNSTLNFVEDGAAQTLNLATLTTVANSNSAPTFTITTQPTRGTLTIAGSTITYTPADDDFTTTALSFVYRAAVGTASDTGTVSINISSVNDAPVAGVDSVFAPVGVTTTFASSVFLANDRPGPSNESSQTLRITSVSNPTQGGAVSVDANTGVVTYSPATGFEGTAQFNYTLSDGSATSTGTVNVQVANFQPSSISGQIFMDLLQTVNSTTRDVIRQSNEPVVTGLMVKLSAAGKADVITHTDTAGNYEFNITNPGTYTVSFIAPDTVIAGSSRAGAQASAISGSAIRVVVPQLGGVTATGNNFTILATRGAAAAPGIGSSPLDLLVKPYGASADASAAVAVLDAAGNQQFFDLSAQGYEHVVFAEVAVNAAHDEALLTILDDNGVVKSLLLDSTQFSLSSDHRLVRVEGGANSFAPATATPAQLAAEFGAYRDSVDAVLASGII